jgi:hypothetical protein
VSHEAHHEDREDRIILAALETLGVDLGTTDGDIVLPRGDETTETLTRLYVEALGLLTYSLAPAAPPPALRERLMAVVQGDETQAVAPVAGAAAPAELPAAARAAGSAPPAPMAAIVPIERGRRGAPRWLLALAATLAFAFAGLSAYLYSELLKQGQTIDTLSASLQAEQSEGGDVREQLVQMESQLGEMRGSMALFTPGVEVAPMRPVANSAAPVPESAGGVLFIAADHQHWYLSVQGLEPVGGRRYQLWFMTDTGEAVSGGSFDARPGSPMNLTSKTMPHGTRKILITLEPESGAPAPTGPRVLQAGQPVKVI